MADLLATAASWVASQQKSHLSQTVIYVRGQLSVSVSATLGQSEEETFENGGTLVNSRSKDFIIDTADLILDSATVLPKRGDIIKQTIDSVVHKFEVMTENANEPPWRYTDDYQTRLRIHTKFAGTES